MIDFLVYTGIAIILVGCLVCFYGAIKYMKVKNSDARQNVKTEARLSFARYRLTWMIMVAVGCVVVFLASFVS